MTDEQRGSAGFSGGRLQWDFHHGLLAALDATPLTGLGADPRNPFISPDGNWVGFFDGVRALQRVSINGGPPVAIVDLPGPPRGASWGTDDTIIFATSDRESGLLRVPQGGGDLEVVTTPDAERGELDHSWPEILPGGEAVLFTIVTSGRLQDAEVAVLALESGDYDVLVQGSNPPLRAHRPCRLRRRRDAPCGGL